MGTGSKRLDKVTSTNDVNDIQMKALVCIMLIIMSPLSSTEFLTNRPIVIFLYSLNVFRTIGLPLWPEQEFAVSKLAS